ncbi:MAG: DNA-binding domain-containing protein [Bacillota bacterium]
MKFYLIDDDLSIIKMLENIILENQLGTIVGKSTKARKAIDEIIDVRPDIVLIDLLLPEIDGINIIKEIKKYDENIFFIMVSEVFSKDMISKAFSIGVEYYINKPINIIESKSIIKKVIEKRKNLDLIESYKNVLSNKALKAANEDITLDQIIAKLNKIGLTGVGKIDLAKIIYYIIENDEKNTFYNEKMSKYYSYVANEYEKDGKKVKTKTIKQRIRRSIIDAFKSIASIGLEDFLDPLFNQYSSSLFKFSEIRKEMNYLKGSSKKGGSIDVKRFIGGFIISLLEEKI